MAARVHGIHHVTCISGDAQENLDFYVGVLGMRLVKRSVNQDDPGTYHLFYADSTGTPGTDLTFFPWPQLAPSQPGTGGTVEVPFAIPSGSIDFWLDRLEDRGVDQDQVETRFGDRVLPFNDPHGLRLALVETDRERRFVPWKESPVPVRHQLRGMHSVRLWERDLSQTESLLTGQMGFRRVASEEGWHRYALEDGAPGKLIDLKELPAEGRARLGVGGVHHVAWRVKDSEEQMKLRQDLAKVALRPTQQIDRFWFKSVYFTEPGGVLFELATDGPGFEVDEEPEKLGERLVLPPWLEDRRDEIEAALPSIEMPRART